MNPAIIAGGTALLGGIMSGFGAQQAAETSAAAANRATDVNQYEAMQNRIFQTNIYDRTQAFEKEMSNTSYQRAVEDLKKAGLNPMLAVPGGASTPSGGSASGAQATAAQPPPMRNSLGEGIQAAVSIMNTINEARTSTANARYTEALAESADAKRIYEVNNLIKSGQLTDAQRKSLELEFGKKGFTDRYFQLLDKLADGIFHSYKHNLSNKPMREQQDLRLDENDNYTPWNQGF